MLGKAFLSYTELMTVLTDIEAIINSLPLTYVGDDIRERRIITPALLAMGRDLRNPRDVPPRKAEVSLLEHFGYQQRLQSHFWSHSLREYLLGLSVRQRWTREEIPLKENDVVLISEDKIPRGKWKLGKIMDTFPRKDGNQERNVKYTGAETALTKRVEGVLHCKLLRFRKPGTVKETKHPRKCQRLMTVYHWWGKVYRTMNRDFKTFKFDACGCGVCCCLFHSTMSQSKTHNPRP